MLLVPVFQGGGAGRRGLPAPVVPPTVTPARHRIVSLEPAAAALFSVYLEQTLVERGFAKLMEVRNPEGPLVSEYQKDSEFLSLTLQPPHEGRQDLAIEFEVASWEDLVTAAVHAATRELVSGVPAPFGGGDRAVLSARVRTALTDLLADVEQGRG